MNRDKLNRIEGIGFYIAIAFASIVIGFGIIGVVGKIIMTLNK